MKRSILWIFLFLAFTTAMIALSLVRVFADWLWFSNLEVQGVFLTVLLAKVKMGLAAGGIFFAIVAANILVAGAASKKGFILTGENVIELPGLEAIGPHLTSIAMGGATLVALAVGSEAVTHWDSMLLFLNPTSFGKVDPIFGLDVGFFVFRLPFLNYLYQMAQTALVFGGIAAASIYFLKRGFVITQTGVRYRDAALRHLFVLLGSTLVLKAAGYKLLAYNMMFTSRGFVSGAGYADVHVRMPMLAALSVLCLIAAAAMVAGIVAKNWKIPAGALLLLAIGMVVGKAYPEIIQRLRVTPNEISMERPYIENQIEFTRSAYDLDRVRVEQFPAEMDVSAADIRANDLTVKNFRLWDSRPLLQTYQQIQEIRTYYSFVDVDIDRYQVDGELRQVMLSARELSSTSLPSRTWVNEHLSFTHGYGVCMSPVNLFTPEGMPYFFIKDIPPVHTTEITVDRPQIYYGELSDNYVFTKTGADEFDYPKGDQNVLADYSGAGGVPVNSFFRRLLFALRFSSLDILLNTDMNSESRIMMYRSLHGNGTSSGRPAKVMPLLLYDNDPYIVIADGNLKWVVDAYTHSMFHPYSEHRSIKGMAYFNYIRNSVKVVIDAYDGTMDFYAYSDQDPIIRAYMKIFPGLFHPISEMPKEIRDHVRYPLTLFKEQLGVYSIYQMTDPLVFYNKEDMWTLPLELYEENQRKMEPYYTVMRLPQEKKEEFILMMPFTPIKKDNLSAWMCARNDGENYGELLVYKFPKKKLIYGPSQVEARINQDPEISRQLSLWSQKGSQVIRGNLLVIPIEDSLLYIEPLFLRADRGAIPELRRVIVSDGNSVSMEPTLELALENLIGESVATAPRETVSGEGAAQAESVTGLPISRSAAELLRQALDHLESAKGRMKTLDWQGFGEQFRLLEKTLKELQDNEDQTTEEPEEEAGKDVPESDDSGLDGEQVDGPLKF